MAIWVTGCGRTVPATQSTLMQVDWKKMDLPELPDAVQVWEGEDEDLPLKAWFVKVDPKSDQIDIKVHSSSDADGRQSAVDFALQQNACVVVNGGYFKEEKDLYSHIGLLLADGKYVHAATPGVFVDGVRYPVTRSAIGFSDTNVPEIAWVSTLDGTVFKWDTPLSNAPGIPADQTGDSLAFSTWQVRDAIEAGPMLLEAGSPRITVNEEVFFGTTIPEVHPRTAVGIDKEGRLILMIVDGRQRNSRGLSLAELAGLMQAVGAVKAMNLDGGGSSTLIVGGKLINLPTGGTFQREIVSAIGIHC